MCFQAYFLRQHFMLQIAKENHKSYALMKRLVSIIFPALHHTKQSYKQQLNRDEIRCLPCRCDDQAIKIINIVCGQKAHSNALHICLHSIYRNGMESPPPHKIAMTTFLGATMNWLSFRSYKLNWAHVFRFHNVFILTVAQMWNSFALCGAHLKF